VQYCKSILFITFACLPIAGCVITDVGVTNPVDSITTVAVVPFFNLSQERTVDGRRFAMAYFSELQKIPGFQVLPVGVTEQALESNQLELSQPSDVLKLAEILNVDAVAVGSVTEYEPYYPPKIGMQVTWYSPNPKLFQPGIPVDPYAREQWQNQYPKIKKDRSISIGRKKKPSRAIRAQSADDTAVVLIPDKETSVNADSAAKADPAAEVLEPAEKTVGSIEEYLAKELAKAEPVSRKKIPYPPETLPPQVVETVPMAPLPQIVNPHQPVHDPLVPVMSYTRIFDGADAKLTANLRDYLDLRNDQRAGGWESYLHRSDDFIQFSAHRMIVEMLMLHGGDAKRRIVLKWRKYR